MNDIATTLPTELDKQHDARGYGELAKAAPSILSIIESAVASGRPASELTELLSFARELDRDAARKAFNAAFAVFKAECPAIVRRTPDGNPKMMKVNREGVRVPRKYASIDDIASVVDPVLSKHGLAYNWPDATVTENGLLTRTFTLTHAQGHERSTPSPPMPIEGTAAWSAMCKERGESSASPQQRYGIADTYAMRYSMIAGLGLTTCDEDTDGANTTPGGEKITEDEVTSLVDLLTELPSAERPKFMAFMRVETLDQIQARDYAKAVDAIKRKLAVTK